MSDRIYSLLAEELDISEKRAQKLLTAMLREVQKRAHRQGVRLPSLGTFREEEGRLTFEPAEPLARTVNQRYEGLENENLDQGIDDANDDSREQEGPSTITLGYQANDWSPIESSDSDEGDQGSDEPSDADTEEFQVLSSEEAADTEEFQTQESFAEESQEPEKPKETPSSESSSTDTEELYPLVEDVPGTSDDAENTDSSSAPDTASFEEPGNSQESLEGVWDDESVPEPEEPQEPPSPSSPLEPSASSESSEPTTKTSAEQPSARSSLVSPILLAPLLLLFLGAGWYLLGQRGVLPSPTTTAAGLTTQFQQHIEDVSLFEKRSSEPSNDAETDTTLSSAVGSSSEEDPSDADEASELTNGGDDPASSTEPSTDPSTLEIDPSAGGWTIIVASRTNRTAADSLVATFRNRIENLSLPIDLVVGEADNTTRYRVAVGQFRTQSEVLQALNKYEDDLPEGAWPLNLR